MYRLSELIQQDRKLFHTNDLAVLWGIANKHTLYMTITRYIDKGVLFPVYKGLYSTVPLASLNPLELGQAIIHRYTYLSTETVLTQAGVISQAVYDYTFVADKSKSVSVGRWSFRYRQLKDDYLHNPAGINNQKGVFVASTERAVADMLYFNPKYHFDVPESIDFDKVRSIQIDIGYPC
jgi:predicted transcriptional regulator of viral defense system